MSRVLLKGSIPTMFEDGTQGEIAAGAWIQPIRRGYILECCACGLDHRLDFRVHAGRAQFRAWRLSGKNRLRRKRLSRHA